MVARRPRETAGDVRVSFTDQRRREVLIYVDVRGIRRLGSLSMRTGRVGGADADKKRDVLADAGRDGF